MSEPEPLAIEVYNSVGGAAFFQRLLNEWETRGGRVTSFCAISESEYRRRRGVLGRCALRWRMYVGYAWTCWRGAHRGAAQSPIRVVTTNPFFAPALVARLTRGRGVTINLLYDLFPEALVQAGHIARGSHAARRGAAIARFALQECTATVFLGDRLRAFAESTYGPARRAVVIAVGADGAPFRNSAPTKLSEGEMPRILYSGQMGRMHETATLAVVLAEPDTTGVTWSFQASGPDYAELRKTTGVRSSVEWGGALSDLAWQQAMKRAHVGLVTIAPGAERVVMPSKTYSALVAGQAILAICRRNSDLADLVVRHDCGWVIEPGDAAGLKDALASIAGNPDELWAKRRNAFEAGHRCYDMTPLAEVWMELFVKLKSDDGARAPLVEEPHHA